MKDVYLFDSTPLIYLGKVKVLEELKRLQSRNLIPKSVFTEVVEKGKEKGAEDAFYVDKLVKEKLFEVVEVKTKIKALTENPNLEPADIDVLSLAKQHNGRAIIDENEARSAAEIEGIKKGGSIYVLFKLLKAKVISKKECREIIDRMLNFGWRCSTEMYAYILSRLD